MINVFQIQTNAFYYHYVIYYFVIVENMWEVS